MSEENVKNKKKLLQNTMFLYLMRISIYVFPLLTTPFLTRVLHENNYGIYTWTNAIINYAKLFVDFGFVLYGIEAIAQCKNNKDECGKIVGIIIKFKIILCFLTGIVLIILCLTRQDFREYSIMIFLSYLSVVISIFNLDYLFQGLEQMKYITIRILITKALFTVLVFAFIQTPERYILIPVFTAISDGISVLLMFWTMHKLQIKVLWVNLKEGYEIFKKSLWFFYSRIFGAVYTYGNLIMMGLIFTKSDIAQYNIAYTLLVLVQNFITPIADSLYPYMIKNKDFKLLKKLILCMEPLILIGCIIAYFVSPWIIPYVFGEEYIVAPEIFRGMLLMVIIALPEYLMGYPALSAFGKFKEPNIAVIIAGCFHVISFIILYFTKAILIMDIVYLTFITEFIVMTVRGIFLFKASRSILK